MTDNASAWTQTWEKWSAIGTLAAALATFLAVIVALIPIAITFFERRRSARALRTRLLLELGRLHAVVQQRLNALVVWAEAFSAAQVQDILSLEAALGQATLLTPKEQDQVAKATALLKMAVLSPLPPQEGGQVCSRR